MHAKCQGICTDSPRMFLGAADKVLYLLFLIKVAVHKCPKDSGRLLLCLVEKAHTYIFSWVTWPSF